jgi:type II secretory pathway component GspD/PulD (secretin)
MRSTLVLSALLFVPFLPAHAQGTVYKVEYRIHDGNDPAAKAGRRYTILIDSTGRGTFRVGDRVPVATGSFQSGVGGAGVNPLVNTQFNYLDIGVNIETKLGEKDGKVELNSNLDLSTISEHKPQPGSPVMPAPTVAQMKIAVDALVSPGKPTLVASIDDPVTQRKVEVEAIVTKVD